MLDHEAEGVKVLMALSNFEALDGSRFGRIESVCREKYDGRIFFAAVSFEDFLAAVQARVSLVSKNLADVVSDFRDYLNSMGLLPNWQRLLDVVNCATLPREVEEGRVYMCPASGGAYNHSRCKYFGMYRWKCVRHVALIEAVVELSCVNEARLYWKHVDRLDQELIAVARERHELWRSGAYPTRVFVLGKMYPTEFRKDSPGGMMGSKQYFDIGMLNVEDAQALATALRGKTWSNYNA